MKELLHDPRRLPAACNVQFHGLPMVTYKHADRWTNLAAKRLTTTNLNGLPPSRGFLIVSRCTSLSS